MAGNVINVARAVVFCSFCEDPNEEDDPKWEPVKPENVPRAIRQIEEMGRLLATGEMACMENDDGDYVWYRVVEVSQESRMPDERPPFEPKALPDNVIDFKGKVVSPDAKIIQEKLTTILGDKDSRIIEP